MTTTTDIRTDDLEQYRRELTGYCYRMLGSAFEAEDAVQETMLRAWKGLDGFEGRSAVRSWMYRIATNVCLDMLRNRERRAQPMDFGPARPADAFDGATLPESAWMSPIPDHRVLPEDGDPAELVAARETIRLAFVTALQHLLARQRAVLILREVLCWQAAEVAELLGTTVVSVNSALQRARATLAGLDVDAARTPAVAPDQQDLVARYVDAFERYDVTSLVALLHDDAVMTMPPFDFWLRGSAEIGRFYVGPGIGCQGSRVIVTAANGGAAFASYKPDGHGGFEPWAVHLLDLAGDRVVGQHSFLDPRLFELFGLPAHLDQ